MAIITISRLAGSLGDEIARTLAAQDGYRLLGHQDFQEAASRHDPELASRLEHFFREEGPGFFERLFFSRPAYLSLYRALVFELAAQRRVIIMGRGAQIVLRDIPQVLRVRVVAPTQRRVLHMCGAHGMDPEEALEYIRGHDHRREALVRQIYEKDPGHWRLYDLVLNTERLDEAAGVEAIRLAAGQIARLYPLEEAPPVLLALAWGKRVEARLRLEAKGGRQVSVMGQPDGRLVLTGTVPSRKDHQAVEQMAAAQPGVSRVENQLKYSVFGYGG